MSINQEQYDEFQSRYQDIDLRMGEKDIDKDIYLLLDDMISAGVVQREGVSEKFPSDREALDNIRNLLKEQVISDAPVSEELDTRMLVTVAVGIFAVTLVLLAIYAITK